MLARRKSIPMSVPVKVNDVTGRLQPREQVQEPVGAVAPSKVMITATTYMTMMVYETQRPVATAGRVGMDAQATPAAYPADNGISQPASTGNATSIVSPNRKSGSYPLSESTEHVLIAAGAIGAAIVLGFIVYLLYRVRTGTPFRDFFKTFRSPQSIYPKSRGRPELKPSAPFPVGSEWRSYQMEKNAWDAETSFAGSSTHLGQSHPFRPNPAFMRPGTSSSNRSLMTGRAPSVAPFPPPNRRSMSVPPSIPLPPNPPFRDTRRPSLPPSLAPSSPILPIERPLEDNADTQSSNLSPVPQYLNSRVTGSVASPPKVSRFSWTNSQAPKTPMEARFSIASSSNSIARYRTVESWVGQQADRVEGQKLQDQLREQIEAAIQEVNAARSATPKARPSTPRADSPSGTDTDTLPSLPEMPTQFASASTRRKPLTVSTRQAGPDVPKKDVPEQEAKHITQGSDAPIFRAHPGTEVRIPSGNFIPSVILDGKIAPNAF